MSVSPDTVIADGVLTLRRQRPDDLEAHLSGTDEEQIAWLWEPGDREKWECLTPAEQREHQRRHLEGVAASFGPGPKWCFSVDSPDAAYVAYVDCDLANPNVAPGQANISYAVHPAHRGKGYASRAVRLVCHFLEQHTEAREAHLLVDRRNVASIRVAQSVGAAEAGTFVDRHGRSLLRHVLLLSREPRNAPLDRT